MNRTQEVNVLVVDDELGPRESLKMILKPFYNVFTAENGQEALKIIHEKPIDIATLDYKMPGMTGTELLREIRKFNEEMAVIMITGFGTMKSAVEGIRYGASDYLVKPFEVNEIIEIVKKNLDKKKTKNDVKKFVAEMVAAMGAPLPGNDFTKLNSTKAYVLKKMETLFSGLNHGIKFQSKVNTVVTPLKDLINTAETRSSLNNHSTNVVYFSKLIGKRLNLNPNIMNSLEIAASLHDIGMLGVYYQNIDWGGEDVHFSDQFCHQKAELGASFARILELPELVINGIAHLGERFNGQGLPSHLLGEEIPLLSRIIALSEAVENHYRKEEKREKVMSFLKEKSGQDFDPNLVQLMVNLIDENEIK
jgi:putative two-component system response regulator